MNANFMTLKKSSAQPNSLDTSSNSNTFATITRRRSSTFPCRSSSYFDFTKWGGGYTKCNGMPGACVLDDNGTMGDLSNGKVYYDERFDSRVDGRDTPQEIVIDNRSRASKSHGVIP